MLPREAHGPRRRCPGEAPGHPTDAGSFPGAAATRAAQGLLLHERQTPRGAAPGGAARPGGGREKGEKGGRGGGKHPLLCNPGPPHPPAARLGRCRAAGEAARSAPGGSATPAVPEPPADAPSSAAAPRHQPRARPRRPGGSPGAPEPGGAVGQSRSCLPGGCPRGTGAVTSPLPRPPVPVPVPAAPRPPGTGADPRAPRCSSSARRPRLPDGGGSPAAEGRRRCRCRPSRTCPVPPGSSRFPPRLRGCLPHRAAPSRTEPCAQPGPRRAAQRMSRHRPPRRHGHGHGSGPRPPPPRASPAAPPGPRGQRGDSRGAGRGDGDSGFIPSSSLCRPRSPPRGLQPPARFCPRTPPPRPHTPLELGTRWGASPGVCHPPKGRGWGAASPPPRITGNWEMSAGSRTPAAARSQGWE